MKKSLLLGGAVLLMASAAQQTHAQAWSQDFNSGNLPSNWVLINDVNTPSTTLLSTAAQTKMASAGWSISATKGTISGTSNTDYCAFSISAFTPAATADRWMITHSFTVSAGQYLTWEDFSLQTPADSIEVLVSPTAGTTAASFTASIYKSVAPDANTTGTYANQHLVSLAAYSGQTIRVAFREHSTNKLLLYVDNVAVRVVPAAEMALTGIAPVPGSPFSFKKSGTSVTFSGIIKNNGSSAITSYTFNYRQGTNPVVSMPLTTSLAPLASGTFTATTPYAVTASGNFPIKAWVTLTGDADHSNDSAATTIIGVDSLINKMVLFEEFNQASCDPCAAASPNVDSVIANNLSRMNAVRYHVWYPGRDCMDSVTKAPFVGTWANTYYAVSGVPDAKMDGYLDVYPGASQFKSSLVASEQAAGAPMRITPTASYNARTKTYTVTAAIKSFAPLSAGLKCRAVLTIDTIRYRLNQSTESIAQTVFPQVAENMFGGTSGTALTAFTANQTQNVNLSWVKDHPWGSNYSVWAYDSTLGGHVTVWVQDDATKSVYQSASIPVSTVYSTDVPVVAGTKGSISVYPNPAVNEATVSLSLNSTANVSLQVFDIAGKVVFNMPAEKRASGSSIVVIDASKLVSGNYFVKAIVDGEVITQKMTIAK